MVYTTNIEYKGYTITIGQEFCMVWRKGWNKGRLFPTEDEAREWIKENSEND